MPAFIAFLMAASGPSIDPEMEAVMSRRASRADRALRQPSPSPSSPSIVAHVIDPALEDCVDVARGDASAGIKRARQWIARSDGPSPRHCLGFAFAQAGNLREAASAFRDGARLAGNDTTSAARLWAQAGNAALAGNDMSAAMSALDTALAGTALPDGLERGEAYLDRARARVATRDEAGARADLDLAIRLTPDDPLAWLLSATLARRMNNLPLARQHIARAIAIAADDATVMLEQGVIAALSQDDVAARQAFRSAQRLGTGTPIATSAATYLTQLDENPVDSTAKIDPVANRPQSR